MTDLGRLELLQTMRQWGDIRGSYSMSLGNEVSPVIDVGLFDVIFPVAWYSGFSQAPVAANFTRGYVCQEPDSGSEYDQSTVLIVDRVVLLLAAGQQVRIGIVAPSAAFGSQQLLYKRNTKPSQKTASNPEQLGRWSVRYGVGGGVMSAYDPIWSADSVRTVEAQGPWVLRGGQALCVEGDTVNEGFSAWFFGRFVPYSL